MAALIPAAMRGLTSERMLGTYGNLADARQGLIDAIVALLSVDQAPDRPPTAPA